MACMCGVAASASAAWPCCSAVSSQQSASRQWATASLPSDVTAAMACRCSAAISSVQAHMHASSSCGQLFGDASAAWQCGPCHYGVAQHASTAAMTNLKAGGLQSTMHRAGVKHTLRG